MKRSQINAIMRQALDFFEERKIHLPSFCYWSPEDWEKTKENVDEIRDNALGWDITDYGHGKFEQIGLLLVTTRNGNQHDKDKYPKPYAEKVMLVRDSQVTPMHFHWYKMEDIINRGGGNLMIKLYNSTEDEKLADTDVEFVVDGVRYTRPAGYELRLLPGEGITLPQGMYHSFWGEKGKGDVLVMEVSMCNDDDTDNRFYEKQGRFPTIEEDEAPLHYLCKEYPKA